MGAEPVMEPFGCSECNDVIGGVLLCEFFVPFFEGVGHMVMVMI